VKRSALALIAALVAAFAVMGAAATLGVSSKKVDSFTRDQAATTVPANPPAALTKLEMFDVNANGKVDRVVATFNKALQASTSTTGWALSTTPSQGELATVAASGADNTATVTISEGTQPADTAVGGFTVGLLQNASTLKDADGLTVSFDPIAPLDLAKPVPVSLTMSRTTTGGNVLGRPDRNDTQLITFSEALVPDSVCKGQTGPFTLNHNNDDNVTASLANGTPEVLSVASTQGCDQNVLNTGTILLGQANYLASGTVTFSGSGENSTEVELLGANKQLRIKLGSLGGNPSITTQNDAALMATYVPSGLMKDAAGNVATGSVTFTGVQF
jgi:hypothetical protein